MANLQRRSSGIYVARLAAPPRFQPLVGLKEFIETTGGRSLAMAKLVGSAKVATWRRQLFELNRLALGATPMDSQTILRIADGHPLLHAAGHLPLVQAAAAAGIAVSDLLRQAADGHLDLFVRLTGEPGYVAPYSAFDVDDSELGTRLIRGPANMPRKARRYVASGAFKIPSDEVKPLASHLLSSGSVDVMVFESLEDAPHPPAFVPDKTLHINVAQLEVLAAAVEAIRSAIAASITPKAVDLARSAQDGPRARGPEAIANSARPLSDAIQAFASAELSQTIISTKEIERIRSGLSLLVEFEGDVPVGTVDATMLRHFRDHHLSRMPARENRVRLMHKTLTMSQSIDAVAGTDWSTISADERDLRMKWLSRMFAWLHRQKWIAEDPSTGLRRESVQTKAQRAQARTERKDREEFTIDELQLIFGAPWFTTGAWTPTKEGTYREFQPFHCWLPLLGAFTGARIGELTQLHLEDVCCTEAGTWFMDINQKTPDKSLKNHSSIRRVPLHPKLIELGFPGCCARLKREGYSRVFPELSWDPGKRYALLPPVSVSHISVSADVLAAQHTYFASEIVTAANWRPLWQPQVAPSVAASFSLKLDGEG